MSDVAIAVEGLGKRYRIGTGPAEPYGNIRESMMRALVSPLRRLHGKGRTPSVASEVWALKDVSFEVKHGEAVGIIGRNGAGKSTLLKVLSRITEPTAGRAVVHGRVGSLLEVGTGFHPELTGRENIYLNGAVMGMSRADIKRRFDEIVEFSGIAQYLDTPVKRYSSGMYMRLAFAIAAHLEPEVLVVDEVLAVGDAEFQKKCLGKMGEVAHNGRTVLFVSHNMAAVGQLCPRSILVQRGNIIKDGKTSTVVQNYLTIASKESEGDIDITDQSLRRNSRLDSQFKWTRISFKNARGELTSVIGFEEPFEIILQGVALSEVPAVRVGFSVHSALGYPVFNSFASDSGLPAVLPAGPVGYCVRFSSNMLAPGLYEVGLGANGPNVVDWLPFAAQFSISHTGGDNGSAWENYRGGLIRYPCTWSSREVAGIRSSVPAGQDR